MFAACHLHFLLRSAEGIQQALRMRQFCIYLGSGEVTRSIIWPSSSPVHRLLSNGGRARMPSPCGCQPCRVEPGSNSWGYAALMDLDSNQTQLCLSASMQKC